MQWLLFYPWVNPQPVVPPVNPYPCSRVGSETGTGPGKALDTRGYTRAIRYFRTARFDF
jgi:hypothetical protein